VSKRIRIKDIAEKAGVSIGTVDRVLHNRGEVAERTRQVVLEIARELNYTPNLAAQALTLKKPMRLAALLPLPTDENIFWAKHAEGMRMGVNSLEPFLIDLTFYHFDLLSGEEFSTQAQHILDEGTDGVILAPVLKQEAKLFCHQLDEQTIPYIFIDTHIQNTNCLSFIGEDAYQSGRIAASLLDFGIGADQDILIVNISKDLENTQHLNSRNQGFLSYFMDAGKNTGIKISVEIPSSSLNMVKQKIDPILVNNPGIKAILVTSAKTYAIARYLEHIKRRDILLVGYEAYDKNVDYLKRHYIQFLISQRPLEQGLKAVQKLFAFLAHNTVPEKNELQAVDIINSENLPLFSR
jgi:LacI family transcriptional regulator